MGSRGRLLGAGAIALVVLLVYAAWLTAQSRARAEIERVRQEASALRSQRDSIAAVVAVRDSLSAELDLVADRLGMTVDSIRRQVSVMEGERAEAQLDTWLLRSDDDVERSFRENFPEFAPSMRVTEMKPEPDLLPLRYLMVPFQTARSFVSYRQNAEAYLAQRDALLTVDSLNTRVQLLQDSVITLTRANEAAYRQGYDEALTRYMALNDDYVELLRKPRFDLDLGSKWGLAGVGVAGLTIGLLVR